MTEKSAKNAASERKASFQWVCFQLERLCSLMISGDQSTREHHNASKRKVIPNFKANVLERLTGRQTISCIVPKRRSSATAALPMDKANRNHKMARKAKVTKG